MQKAESLIQPFLFSSFYIYSQKICYDQNTENHLLGIYHLDFIWNVIRWDFSVDAHARCSQEFSAFGIP